MDRVRIALADVLQWLSEQFGACAWRLQAGVAPDRIGFDADLGPDAEELDLFRDEA